MFEVSKNDQLTRSKREKHKFDKKQEKEVELSCQNISLRFRSFLVFF